MSWFNDSKTLKNIAFAVYGDICSVDTSAEGEEKLHERIKRIHAGLAPESEFLVQAAWLGNCETINRIDQTPPPTDNTNFEFRAPDFLSVIRHDGKPIPLLIEVKASEEDKLVWTESYLRSLENYASLLKLPLLVAWKRGMMWTLVDVRHFEKKVDAYHLTLQKAMMENLMGKLLGEAWVVLKQDFRFVIEAEIQEEMPEDIDAIVPPGTFTFTLKDVGFFLGQERLKALEPEYVWLFMACSEGNSVQRLSRQLVRIVHIQEEESMFPLFHVMLAMAVWGVKEGEEVDWNAVIRKGPIPISGPQFRKALERGIKRGFVRYVISQVPQTIPDFLSGH